VPMHDMRRRELIGLLGGAAAAWPLAVRAQQPAMPVIGFLSSRSAKEYGSHVAGFRHGLKGVGYVEGQNVAIEFRWGETHFDRLPALAADLVQRRVNVIFAGGGSIAALAAKAATSTIPIVFNIGIDPVAAGLVASLNRPGGNITGATLMSNELNSKRIQLLCEAVPTAGVIAHLVDPAAPNLVHDMSEVETAVRMLGRQVKTFRSSSGGELESAFAALAVQRVGALIVEDSPLFSDRLQQIAALAIQSQVPTLFAYRDFPSVGGLMSYGPNREDHVRQAGVYVGRILKGEKPADLPIIQPTSFELVINLKTAKALGLDVPATLLALADEVIE
jgi:putative tryptophan/tyrosine transport system substrate-binding protein